MTKTTETKATKAKNAVKKVKEAPKKIVEHTLSTAIQTVEKQKDKEKAPNFNKVRGMYRHLIY